MDFFSVIIFTISAFCSIWFMKTPKGKKSLPGPLGFPIVGYLPFLTEKPYMKLAELSKTYGPLYSLYLGSKRFLVLTDFECIKEAFRRDDFQGRPLNHPLQFEKETQRTNAFDGKPWNEQRRFCLHSLKDLGFGKTHIEELMKEEITELVDRMSEHVGKTVKMADFLSSYVSNNMSLLLFGRRMRLDDPKRKLLDRLFADAQKYCSMPIWLFYFPWIRAFVEYFGIGDQGKKMEAIEGLKTFIREEVNEHVATLNPDSIRDFVDMYLLEIQKRSNVPGTPFNNDVLEDVARILFGSGSRTVKNSVDWMLLLCAAIPEVQSRIHQEVDKVVGPDRFPTGQDRFAMPYTEAAICEMMRWFSIMPMNQWQLVSSHSTLEDTELNGFYVPKGTNVLAVFWALDHNKSLWGEDVFEYRPERFLSDDGKKVIKPEYFIPFSTGKRKCPAKSQAEIEVFLFVTAILQKYELRIPTGQQADLEAFLEISFQPKIQELCLNYRKTR